MATGTAPEQTVLLLRAIMQDPAGRAELAIAQAAKAAGTAIDCPAITVLADGWRTRNQLAEADRLQALACAPAG